MSSNPSNNPRNYGTFSELPKPKTTPQFLSAGSIVQIHVGPGPSPTIFTFPKALLTDNSTFFNEGLSGAIGHLSFENPDILTTIFNSLDRGEICYPSELLKPSVFDVSNLAWHLDLSMCLHRYRFEKLVRRHDADMERQTSEESVCNYWASGLTPELVRHVFRSGPEQTVARDWVARLVGDILRCNPERKREFEYSFKEFPDLTRRVYGRA